MSKEKNKDINNKDINNINKPITMACEDFKVTLTNLINETPMPLFMIEYIMKDITSLVHNAAQQQLVLDTEQYNKAIMNNDKDCIEKNNIGE